LIIHSWAGTVAKCHDSTQREQLLHGEERIIDGDKGYANDKFKNQCLLNGVFVVLMTRQNEIFAYQIVKKSITISYQVREQKWSIHFK
jgi:hypothetical protein